MVLAFLLLLLASCYVVVVADTVFTNEALVVSPPNNNHHSLLQLEHKANSALRFRDSIHRSALYEASSLGKKYYKQAFGERIKALLQHVVNTTTANAKHQQVVQHHMVPMRDGVKLSTIVIFPPRMDQTLEQRSTMMSRSPYGPTSDQIADIFTLLNGMVAVVQDQRGTFLSEGEFTMWTHDAEDGEDTLNWILQQKWSNGKVFGSGISADGCSLASMFRLQPAPKLSGAMYMWSSADGHETTYPGGSFRAGLISGWMAVQAALTRGTSLTKTLPQLLENWKLVPGGFWEPIQGPGKFHQVNWPTVHITGWYDIFQGLQINMYNEFRSKGPQHLEHRLIVGALGHCIAGLPVKGDPMLDLVEARAIQMGFGYASELFGGFEERGHLFRDMLDLINIYVQGSKHLLSDGLHTKPVGHYWSSFASWPQPEYRKMYLHPANKLSFAAVMSNNNLRGAAENYVEYMYNPQRPVTTHGGNNFVIHLLGFGCGSMDQRDMEKRADVAVFDLMQPLDQALALTGEVTAVLFVSTDAKDTDFHVSLNDVHPKEKYSMQIRSGLQRLRLKDSTEFETVVTEVEKDRVYRVEVKMWFTSYIVAPNHKLRVVVTSSNAPYYAHNANTGRDDDQYGLKAGVVAKNRVYFSNEYPSHVILPVVQESDLPKNHRI